MTTRRSRIAPSPTGSLHLGNASTFLINWAIARTRGWELIMRIEDLAGPRIQAASIDLTLEILEWLGIDWDGSVLLQSKSMKENEVALTHLIETERVYHCNLSRTQMEQASSAPHKTDTALRSTVRPQNIRSHNASVGSTPTNWRFIVQDTKQTISDEVCGEVSFEPSQDYVIWTRGGNPSYQLAVVVDDHNQGITDVIRGNDLLQSAAWQEQLYEAMGWEKPRWWHVPLVVSTDGKRLAKRHGDSRISTYRSRGVSPDRIIGIIARWCGIQDKRSPMEANTFCGLFDLSRLPVEDMVFTHEDEQWLFD